MKHHIPSKGSRTLDLHIPPENQTAAAGYESLVLLLEDLGKQLDEGLVSKENLRRWEQQVIGNLHDREIDRFMQVPEEEEFDPEALPEQRWRNLRSILLARKGFRPQIC